MSIGEYFGDWLKVIDVKEMNRVLAILEKQYQIKSICPLYKDIFKAFHLCPLNNLKILILAQDPYADLYKGSPRATGLAFANSNKINDEDLSPSLKIIKESVINFEKPHNYITFVPELEEWSKQGILLLNSALTVEKNNIGSHIMLWRPFISSLLRNLSVNYSGLLYVLFGSQAQSFEPYINKLSSTIMKIKHPAYYARVNGKMPYSVWTDIDKFMQSHYGMKIQFYKELKYES